MTALPSIPRLYTALAECLAVGIYALPLGLRFGKTATIAASAAWALALSAFLQATGSVPLAWWIPCMAAAVGIQYLYLWVTRTISLLEAGYVCARAFVLAELAASAEWQLHCFLWPQRSGADGLSLLLLVVVYGGVFGCIWCWSISTKVPRAISSSAEKRPRGRRHGGDGLCGEQPAVLGRPRGGHERLLHPYAGGFLRCAHPDGPARAAAGAALHSELAAMDEVLHRQYEQYKRSKEASGSSTAAITS